jgi:hypothetical protein
MLIHPGLINIIVNFSPEQFFSKNKKQKTLRKTGKKNENPYKILLGKLAF